MALPALMALLIGLAWLARPAWARWWRMLKRMRWLLVCVALIVAYGVPGDALLDISWLPTYQGGLEAVLHVIRLSLMLGCLAALFATLGEQGMLVALLGIIAPISSHREGVERFVVRLTLVMENLQGELPAGGWRKILAGVERDAEPEGRLQVVVPAWAARDFVVSAGGIVLLATAVIFG